MSGGRKRQAALLQLEEVLGQLAEAERSHEGMRQEAARAASPRGGDDTQHWQSLITTFEVIDRVQYRVLEVLALPGALPEILPRTSCNAARILGASWSRGSTADITTAVSQLWAACSELQTALTEERMAITMVCEECDAGEASFPLAGPQVLPRDRPRDAKGVALPERTIEALSPPFQPQLPRGIEASPPPPALSDEHRHRPPSQTGRSATVPPASSYHAVKARARAQELLIRQDRDFAMLERRTAARLNLNDKRADAILSRLSASNKRADRMLKLMNGS